MTLEHQTTREVTAYQRIVEENLEMLSEAARTIAGEADLAAYTENLIHNVIFGAEDYYEAMEKMCLAAAGLTVRDRKILTKLWRAALAAASSIDPDDYEAPVGDRVYRENLHQYYRMVSSMVEESLQAKSIAEIQKKISELREEAAKWIPVKQMVDGEPEDFSDILF
jgi:hypothetical protein